MLLDAIKKRKEDIAAAAAKQKDQEKAKEPVEYKTLKDLGEKLGLKVTQQSNNEETAAVYFALDGYSPEITLSTAIGIAGAVVTKIGDSTCPSVAIEDERLAEKLAEIMTDYLIGKEVAVTTEDVAAEAEAKSLSPKTSEPEKKPALANDKKVTPVS
jgi:hypothetical protein